MNGSTVARSGDLVVDARSLASAFAGVAVQRMTKLLGGDLTLLVGKFDAINGLNVVWRDGAAHILTVKVGSIWLDQRRSIFSAGSMTYPRIKVVPQTPGKVTVNGMSSLGAILVGAFATLGAVTFG